MAQGRTCMKLWQEVLLFAVAATVICIVIGAVS